MTILAPDPNRSRPSNLPAKRLSTKGVVVAAMLVSWAGSVFVIPSTASSSPVFAFFAPVVFLIAGTLSGLGIGFGVVGQVFSGAFAVPAVSAAVLGVLVGSFSAWQMRAMEVNGNWGRSFAAALFDAELWNNNAPSFVCKLLVGTFVGYAVALAFASIGVFEPGTADLGNLYSVVFGGGGGPYDFMEWIALFFTLLGALLVAGAIVGGSFGGITGAIFAALGAINAYSVIQGAAEGAAFRFFAHYRPENVRSGLSRYIFNGAMVGVVEGIFVGAISGGVLCVLRLLGIAN